MSAASDEIEAALQTAADSAGGLKKFIFGTPGTWMVWPEPPKPQIEEGRSGGAWKDDGDPSGADTMRKWELDTGIGAYLDKRHVARACVQTNATGVAPTYIEQLGCHAVTTPTKNEGTEQLTVTFASAFSSGYYHACGYLSYGTPVVLNVDVQSSSYITVSFYDLDKNKLDINSQVIQLLCIGFI